MMAGDSVEFCSGTALRKMEGEGHQKWAENWARRIKDYYLAPAHILNERELGFAAMTLICSAIEAIGTTMFPNASSVLERFENTSIKLLNYAGKDPTLLYKHYRCGLVHNGRTNQAGGYRRPNEISAIDYHSPDEFYVKDGSEGATLILINPSKLLKSVERGFDKWLKEQNLQDIGKVVEKEFGDDLTLIRKLDRV